MLGALLYYCRLYPYQNEFRNWRNLVSISQGLGYDNMFVLDINSKDFS